jgi:hypothetical protein
MRLAAHRPIQRNPRRGSALLMAFLMIILLFGIIFQLWLSTNVDLRVADNEVTTTQMDLAVESALQEVYDRLKTDGEAAAAAQSGGGAAPGGDDLGAAPPGGAGAAGAAGGQSQPSDSHEDTWGKPQRTTINDVEIRVVVQDEDSKINVLGMLTEDEEQAKDAKERVARVIDSFREGTTLDVDHADATRIADAMLRHLRERAQSDLPRPKLQSDDEEHPDVGLPLSLREFVVLENFDENLFRDGRDERGRVVHSLGSFLTVWTSLGTHPSGTGGGTGGGGSSGSSGGNSSASNGSNSSQANGSSSGNPSTSGGAGGSQAGNGQNGAGSSGGAGGGGGGGGGGNPGNANYGVAVNINTAPATVLKSLFDDRDVNPRFWDSVIEYRNLEDQDKKKEAEKNGEQTEPVLDEYGNEVIQRQIFDSPDELSEVDGYDQLDAEARNRLPQFVMTQSQVFSIFVTAYRKSKRENELDQSYTQQEQAADKQIGGSRWRTVRSVVWRYQQGDQVHIVPLVRWEVLDYIPIEVLDYPDENR